MGETWNKDLTLFPVTVGSGPTYMVTCEDVEGSGLVKGQSWGFITSHSTARVILGQVLSICHLWAVKFTHRSDSLWLDGKLADPLGHWGPRLAWYLLSCWSRCKKKNPICDLFLRYWSKNTNKTSNQWTPSWNLWVFFCRGLCCLSISTE